MSETTPVAGKQRIASLDVLRGFALLGILVMNIQAFAMPFCAYMNPTSFGDLEGINRAVWGFGHLFFDMKFMSLFSMLFGAGVLLFSERIEARGGKPGALHYRRNFWLVMFGLLHAHLLWSGDVLFCYGICAFFVYLFRRRSARTLFISGILFLLIGTGLSLMFGLTFDYWSEAEQAGLEKTWKPDQADLERQVSMYSSGFAAGMARTSRDSLEFELFIFPISIFWRVMGMMLLGMAFYRWKILSGEREGAIYRKLLMGCGLVGQVLVAIGMKENFAHDHSVGYSMFLGSIWNYWGSVAIAFAYIGLVIGWARSDLWPGLQRTLGAVGQMAFTNYILHTVIGVIVFRVLGYYGSFERWQQLLMVIAIWLFQLWFSPRWLARHRFGPLEWLWRSLTYWKRQPMIR